MKIYITILVLLLSLFSCTAELGNDNNGRQHLTLTNSEEYKWDEAISYINARYHENSHSLSINIVFAVNVWDHYIMLAFDDIDLDTIGANTPIQEYLTDIYFERSNELHAGRDFHIKSGKIVLLSNNYGRLKLSFQNVELWHYSGGWFDDNSYKAFDTLINGEIEFDYTITSY